MPKQREGSEAMTWRMSVSMPPDAGTQLEKIGREMGLSAPVVARIFLLEKLRERAAQEQLVRQAQEHEHE